ncbi:DUF397 domain-containing protein [Sphaerisporangium sp. NPDC051017]|uniref:DUF397 domain-containing protein n=1 Tax=Sphaerisporangium sp. NPDC051017 TaxID=3154636 RepID=UPI003432962F
MTDLAKALWRKSTYSGGGNNCVEIASNLSGFTGVRDSKTPTGPVLIFSADEWAAFVDGVKISGFGA